MLVGGWIVIVIGVMMIIWSAQETIIEHYKDSFEQNCYVYDLIKSSQTIEKGPGPWGSKDESQSNRNIGRYDVVKKELK